MGVSDCLFAPLCSDSTPHPPQHDASPLFLTAVGLHSYRFMEAMSFGCVPVILSDDWVTPFQELVPDVSSYAIMVPEAEWASVPSRLQNLSDHTVATLHANVVRLYEQVFVSYWDVAMFLTATRMPGFQY